MENALLELSAKIINVMGNLVIFVILFQWGIKHLWRKYPFYGVKNSFFLFVTLLGVYGFIRGLITGW